MNMERTESYLRPAVPAATHQKAAGWLFTEIALYARGRKDGCQVMVSPFAVYLNGDGGECLLPDITVLCDESMMDEDGCHGAPDWVVEVVSPDSRAADYGGKLAAYIQAGVREYWALDPERRIIVVYDLETPDVPAVYRFGDSVQSGIFPDFVVDSTPLEEMRCRAAGSREERPECREAGEGFHGRPAGRTDAAQEIGGRREQASRTGGAQKSHGQQAEGAQESRGQRAESLQEQQADGAQEPYEQQAEGAQEPRSRHAPPGQMGAEEVRAYLEAHFGGLASSRNKGQLMKAAMGALKGKADSRTLNEAVAELCRNGTI